MEKPSQGMRDGLPNPRSLSDWQERAMSKPQPPHMNTTWDYHGVYDILQQGRKELDELLRQMSEEAFEASSPEADRAIVTAVDMLNQRIGAVKHLIQLKSRSRS
ncbi:MAG: hypothetical protein HC925_07450 [Coleofasciculaceae cyanobacterium SM2_3_26]|nr:hypothetical protein [Coleofasciculaceae cyanobacterium SM2_3_26]